MRDFLSVSDVAYAELEIQKSRFLTAVYPVSGLEDGKRFLEERRKEYPDATHHCYALRGYPGGNESKMSDDGEPAGTAGAPIWNVIAKRELYGLLVVVTRYFGGIKLGANGLVGAYTAATVGVLDGAKLCRMKDSAIYRVDLPYGAYGGYEKGMESFGGITLRTDFADRVSVTAAVPEDESARFIEKIKALTGGESPKFIENQLRKYSV